MIIVDSKREGADPAIMALAHRRGRSARKVRVLIAVQPVSLFNVIKHVLTMAPEVQLVSSPEDSESLTQQAKRLQPDLVITNARKLGEGACALIADTRRVSPRSRIILTYFDTRIAGGDCEVDEYLAEELLVKRLIAAVRRLSPRHAASVTRSRRRTGFTNSSHRRKAG